MLLHSKSERVLTEILPRSKPVLRDQAYRKFMQLLFDGQQKPGYLVSQRELCELTGCSIGAIREALKRLEAEGVVTLIPQRGVKICEINEAELNDIFQLRNMIEIPAARHFAKIAKAEALAALRKKTKDIIARKVTTSAEKVDLFHEKTIVDDQLHLTIVGSLANRLIEELYKKISNRLRLSRIDVEPRFTATRPAMREHLAILDALDHRDEEAAAQAMAEHLNASRSRALGLL